MMKCNTVKQGKECSFMSKTGCGFIQGFCLPIIEKCDGCKKIEIFSESKFCTAYGNPSSMWIPGICPMATHILREKAAERKLNPLKASKKASKAKKKK